MDQLCLTRTIWPNDTIKEYTHDGGGGMTPFDDFFKDWAEVTIACPVWGNPVKIEDMMMKWIQEESTE
jgi:hypothetical protein